MNIQPINRTTQSFKGTLTLQNSKTGTINKFITNEQTDVEIFKYFYRIMHGSFNNFNMKEHIDALSKIAKQKLGKGLKYPKSNEFLGQISSEVINTNGKEEALNIIAPSGYFRLEHKAPYIDINRRV